MECRPLVVQAPPLGECSRNPSGSVDQLVLLWEDAFGFSELFVKILLSRSPISWWVIYKHTWPHYTECSAVFEQKWYDPHPPAPYSPDLTPSNFFFVSLEETGPQREMFCWCGRGATKKMAEALTRHQNRWLLKPFWAVEKSVNMCIA